MTCSSRLNTPYASNLKFHNRSYVCRLVLACCRPFLTSRCEAASKHCQVDVSGVSHKFINFNDGGLDHSFKAVNTNNSCVRLTKTLHGSVAWLGLAGGGYHLHPG